MLSKPTAPVRAAQPNLLPIVDLLLERAIRTALLQVVRQQLLRTVGRRTLERLLTRNRP